MTRYRSLVARWPALTQQEQEEHNQLAIAGWHEALTLGLGACTCQRQPGDDSERTLCSTCAEETESEEAGGMITIADLLKPDSWDEARDEAAE